MTTKEKFEKDYQQTVKTLTEDCDLLLKGGRMLNENHLSNVEYNVLQEGLWEKVKYGLAKLGRYKAGGKIFGKGKVDQEAGAKIQAILDKKGNEVIKALNANIKETNPEFPNNEEGEKFLKTVMEIAAVYDSIIASTKKKPNEEGFLPADAANYVIADLAEYVQKFLDVDLAGAYTVMDSEEEKVGDENDEELLTDEVEDIKEDEASDTREKLQAKAGDTKYDTKRMGKEGLKSNKLPMLLAGVGASLGAFSWLTNTEWFKSLFQETFQYTDTEKIKSVIETKTQVLNDIKPGEGVYKLLGRVTNHPLDGNSNPSEMVEALKQIGGGDAHKGVDLLCQDGGVMMKPGEAAKGLHNLVNNPDQYDKLGDMFKGTASGTGKLAEPGSGLNTTLYGTVAGKSLTSLLVKKLPIIITKVVVKTGVKTGAGYAVAKGFGAVLGPIGIGLVAAGALVKLMRMKGQKQSRAKTLNDLLQSLQPIKAEEASLPPVLPKPPSPVKGGGSGKDGLYNDLTKFFQFIVNNKKQLNTKSNLFGDALVSKKDRENKNENRMENMSLIIEGKFIKDTRTLEYLTKKSSLDKIKKFEEFLTRLEYIRNVVKKMSNTDDKVINNFVTKLKSNPIMATDFVKMFNVPSDNPKGVQSLKGFIDELFNTLYSGKNAKMFNVVDKMATLGGGNINKVEESYLYEDKGYNVDQPNKAFIKDAQDRTSFKKHLNNFIMGLMGMYQYMHKLKREGKLGSNKEKIDAKPKQEKQDTQRLHQLPQQESNNVLKKKELLEELNRIKRLMK